MNSNRSSVSRSKNYTLRPSSDDEEMKPDVRNIQKIPSLVVDDFEDFQAEAPMTDSVNDKVEDEVEENEVFEEEIDLQKRSAIVQWILFVLLLPIQPFLVLYRSSISSFSYYR